jgi:hypothetical protein
MCGLSVAAVIDWGLLDQRRPRVEVAGQQGGPGHVVEGEREQGQRAGLARGEGEPGLVVPQLPRGAHR